MREPAYIHLADELCRASHGKMRKRRDIGREARQAYGVLGQILPRPLGQDGVIARPDDRAIRGGKHPHQDHLGQTVPLGCEPAACAAQRIGIRRRFLVKDVRLPMQGGMQAGGQVS